MAWLSDVARASLVAIPLLFALVLVCVLLAALAIKSRSFLVSAAHLIVALALLVSLPSTAFDVSAHCYIPSDQRACARASTSFLAAPVLLLSQTLLGLGSLPLGWNFERWTRRLGSVVAVVGVSLPVYGLRAGRNVPPLRCPPAKGTRMGRRSSRGTREGGETPAGRARPLPSCSAQRSREPTSSPLGWTNNC